jgi:hypothetical protein
VESAERTSVDPSMPMLRSLSNSTNPTHPRFRNSYLTPLTAASPGRKPNPSSHLPPTTSPHPQESFISTPFPSYGCLAPRSGFLRHIRPLIQAQSRAGCHPHHQRLVDRYGFRCNRPFHESIPYHVPLISVIHIRSSTISSIRPVLQPLLHSLPITS